MKSIFIVLGFLFALIFLSQCEKYDLMYEIPDEVKFIYEEGDQLTYSCSDGSIDTFLVNDVLYFYNTGEEWDGNWFGGDSYTFSIEHCNIEIRALKDSWSKYLDLYNEYSPCYKIVLQPDIYFHYEELYSYIVNGCNGVQFDDIASGSDHDDYSSRTFNGKVYFNVYHFESSGRYPDEEMEMRYKIFWNMKYGIIRFEGISEIPELSEMQWDLVGKI